jgi:hypothetical protein
MVKAWSMQLHQPGPGDLLGHVAGGLDVGDQIAGAVHDQGGDPDGGEDVAAVQLDQGLVHRPSHGRAGARALEPAPDLTGGGIIGPAGGEQVEEGAIAPVPLELVKALVDLFSAPPPRPVGGGAELGRGAMEDEGHRPVGMGSREEQPHRTTLGNAEEGGPLAAGGVHDRPEVL